MAERKYKLKCQFCSMQDDVILKTNNHLHDSDYSEILIDYSFSSQGLCARGNLMKSLFSHPDRIRKPRISNERASYGLALETFGRMLDEKIAILMGGSLTLEDAMAAISLGNELGTQYVSLAMPEDHAVSYLMNRFSFDSFANSNLVFVIGDVFNTNPTIAHYLMPIVKDSEKKLIVIDNHESSTSRFADHFFRIPPGQIGSFVKELVRWNIEEWANLGKYDVENRQIDIIRNLIDRSMNPIVLFSNNFGQFYQPDRIGYHAQQFAQSLGDQHNFCYLSNGSNSRGIYRLLKQNFMKPLPETIKAIESGKVNKLLLLQCDITESIPAIDLFSIESIIQSSPLPTAITPYCHIVLPGLLLGEKEGHLLNLEEKMIKMQTPAPGMGILPESKIFSDLAGLSSNSLDSTIKRHLKNYRQPEVKTGTFFSIDKPLYIGFTEPPHHADGSITRKILGKLSLNQENDSKYLLENENEPNIEYRNDSLNDEIVLTPIHIPEFRRLFSRKFEPGLMNLRKNG